jgi:hypothetical protein
MRKGKVNQRNNHGIGVDGGHYLTYKLCRRYLLFIKQVFQNFVEMKLPQFVKYYYLPQDN